MFKQRQLSSFPGNLVNQTFILCSSSIPPFDHSPLPSPCPPPLPQPHRQPPPYWTACHSQMSKSFLGSQPLHVQLPLARMLHSPLDLQNPPHPSSVSPDDHLFLHETFSTPRHTASMCPHLCSHPDDGTPLLCFDFGLTSFLWPPQDRPYLLHLWIKSPSFLLPGS